MIPGETIATGAPVKCSDCGEEMKLQVCKSFAGYYIGTQCRCGPNTRESTYYQTYDDANHDLQCGTFGRE